MVSMCTPRNGESEKSMYVCSGCCELSKGAIENTWRPVSSNGFVSRCLELRIPSSCSNQTTPLTTGKEMACHVWSLGQIERAGSLCVYCLYEFPCWFTQNLPNDHASVWRKVIFCWVNLGIMIQECEFVSKKLRFHHHLPLIHVSRCLVRLVRSHVLVIVSLGKLRSTLKLSILPIQTSWESKGAHPMPPSQEIRPY